MQPLDLRVAPPEREARKLLRQMYGLEIAERSREHPFALLFLLDLALVDEDGEALPLAAAQLGTGLDLWFRATSGPANQQAMQRALLALLKEEDLSLPENKADLERMAPNLVESVLDRLGYALGTSDHD